MTAVVTRDEESDEVYEGSRAFVIRKPFDPDQLDAEVTKAMNWRNNAGLVVEGDPAEAAQNRPVRVWVIRGEVDEATFEEVVRHHTPAKEEPTIDGVLARIAAGHTLRPDEVQFALGHLLTN